MKFGQLAQCRHGTRHGVHSEHQRGEAQKYKSAVLFLSALAEHIQYYSCQSQNGSKGGGLKELYKNIVAVYSRKAQHPCGHGCTHVGAHNYIYRLFQRHKPGVYKAHYHYGNGGGALNHGGYPKPRKYPLKPSRGKFPKQGAEALSSSSLQSLSHYIHTEKEQA